MPSRSAKKSKATKTSVKTVWTDDSQWTVQFGELRRGRGRPTKVDALFTLIGEKIPFAALESVKRAAADYLPRAYGVYVAHDSMGYARYIGRGNIFARLKARQKAQSAELHYFSFYVVEEKKHEREIETLLIRAAGPQLHFNNKKRRVDIAPGDVRDFEAGTRFFERQGRRGRRRRRRSPRAAA